MSIKLLRDVLFGVVLCLVGTDYINSANAQQPDQQTIVTHERLTKVRAHDRSLYGAA